MTHTDIKSRITKMKVLRKRLVKLCEYANTIPPTMLLGSGASTDGVEMTMRSSIANLDLMIDDLTKRLQLGFF